MSRIVIRFKNPVQKAEFMKLYRGTPGFFGMRNPNYSGQVQDDRSLGRSFAEWVYLEREEIKDFRQFGQDVAMFGGEIMPYE